MNKGKVPPGYKIGCPECGRALSRLSVSLKCRACGLVIELSEIASIDPIDDREAVIIFTSPDPIDYGAGAK